MHSDFRSASFMTVITTLFEDSHYCSQALAPRSSILLKDVHMKAIKFYLNRPQPSIAGLINKAAYMPRAEVPHMQH